jgi:Ca-activated chloride channel family protein
MYKTMTAPILEPVGDAKVALQSVNIEAEFNNLLCEVNVCQKYKNLESVNIEAVYTFPLTSGAVLLDLTIKTRTKVLKGTVIEKSEAEDRYEDAITDGDTAIMLEQVDPGLYTMNIGNILPEEKVEITLTYAELYRWQDDSLRFLLPTTIAPRYGSPEKVGLEPHQAPEYDLLAENPFSITVTAMGLLAEASFECPSHSVQIEKVSDKTMITLKSGENPMDRDFVLNIRSAAKEKSYTMVGPDVDGHVMLASFQPRFPYVDHPSPRCFTIVVDCSGSMGGDSIAQARIALNEILNLLRPHDLFNVIRFGSHYSMLFSAPVKAENQNLMKARNLLEVLDADMGGTEIGNAVNAAMITMADGKFQKDVLLITDGEVWDWEAVVDRVKTSGVRFFTVGVGNSVSEAFVRQLAEVTGGACELVSPNEGMVDKIVRHFKRIYYPRAEKISLKWPEGAEMMIPSKLTTVFDGDTIFAFARFPKRPGGKVTLTAQLENAETLTQVATPSRDADCDNTAGIPGTLARMAAAAEMKSLIDSRKLSKIAVKYQLMSRYTNYLAIDVKADKEKGADLPVIRKVPQMMAAGWGGSGRVLRQSERCLELVQSMPISSRKIKMRRKVRRKVRKGSFTGVEREIIVGKHLVTDFIKALNNLHSFDDSKSMFVKTIAELKALGLPKDIVQGLTALKESGVDENIIVVLFLYVLTEKRWFRKAMSKQLRRLIIKTYKQLPKFDETIKANIETVI